MPTSNGLSYSMNSFPRSAWTIGAFRASRRPRSTRQCAPAHPAPPRIVTLFGLVQDASPARRLHLRPDRRSASAAENAAAVFCSCLAQCDVAGDRDDRDTPARDRRLHRDLEHARHLFRLRHELAIVAALRQRGVRDASPEVTAANFSAGNLRGNGEHGNTAAVAVVEAVDQMQVARSAAPGADRELSGEVRFGARGERSRLLVADVHPSELVLRSDGSVIPFSESPETP